jgi:hypothetical protein
MKVVRISETHIDWLQEKPKGLTFGFLALILVLQ